MPDNIKRNVLRGIMAEQGHTIASLAREIGVTRATLSNFFNGAYPSYTMMRSMQRELSISRDQAGDIFFDDNLRNT